MNRQVQKAVKILKDGGIVVFPTDTAFGIGCRIDDSKAVERLFRIRKRPFSQATPVLVNSIDMAERYLLPIPKEVVNKLMRPYWPGALTIVLPCKVNKVNKLVRGGGDTLGVRMPSNNTLLFVIRGLDAAILGPSANFHGEETPYKLEDLDPKLVKLVDYVVSGKCLLKKQSTIIDCSQKPWKILREGSVRIN